MAVTSDNKLLLCNRESSHPKVYIYKDYKTYEDELSFTSSPWCITVVPCTDKAVVTLPYEGSIQFINHRFCNPCIYIPSDEMTHDYKVVICCQK
jgi:hypothetical protein